MRLFFLFFLWYFTHYFYSVRSREWCRSSTKCQWVIYRTLWGTACCDFGSFVVFFFFLPTSFISPAPLLACDIAERHSADFPTRPVEQHAEHACRLSSISSSVLSLHSGRCFSTPVACICRARSEGGCVRLQYRSLLHCQYVLQEPLQSWWRAESPAGHWMVWVGAWAALEI